jgi:hypothetical protein
VYSDDDGHTYLIPNEDYKSFIKTVTKLEQDIEYCYLTYKEDKVEFLQEELWDFLSNYETLDGEEYYIILESDLGENI